MNGRRWLAMAALATAGCSSPAVDVGALATRAVDTIQRDAGEGCAPLYVEVDASPSALLHAWADSILAGLRAGGAVASRHPNALAETRSVFVAEIPGALLLDVGGETMRLDAETPPPRRFRGRRWIPGASIGTRRIREAASAASGRFPSGLPFSAPGGAGVAFRVAGTDADTVRYARVSVREGRLVFDLVPRPAPPVAPLLEPIATVPLPGLSGVTAQLDRHGRIAYGRNGTQWGPPALGAGTSIAALDTGLVSAFDTTETGEDGLWFIEIDASRRAQLRERVSLGVRRVRALAVLDADGDGLDDLLVATDDGHTARVGAWVSGSGE